MQWLDQYQLFLFDFDGLLVNTEELHFQAYQHMCQARGFKLPWTFAHYCSIAHYSAKGLREKIYAEFPQLYQSEPNWDILYSEKKYWIEKLLREGAVKLMPGVASLLQGLRERTLTACVVTHSPLEQISLIREQHPLLNTIAHWITRNDYSQPKPHPECYLKAINLYGAKGQAMIGFEDTPRGLQALRQTQALPVWVSQIPYPEIQSWQEQGMLHVHSLADISKALAGKST